MQGQSTRGGTTVRSLAPVRGQDGVTELSRAAAREGGAAAASDPGRAARAPMARRLALLPAALLMGTVSLLAAEPAAAQTNSDASSDRAPASVSQ